MDYVILLKALSSREDDATTTLAEISNVVWFDFEASHIITLYFTNIPNNGTVLFCNEYFSNVVHKSFQSPVARINDWRTTPQTLDNISQNKL